MARRVIRYLPVFFVSVGLLASCLGANPPSSSGGDPANAGNTSSGPVFGAASDGGTDAVADTTAAEPKPLPGGISSPGVDIDDPDAPAVAHSDVRGSYSTVCYGGDQSRFQLDGEIVTTWVEGGEACFPMFNRKLVSVVTVNGEEHWAQHPVENCKFSHVILAPEVGPRKFYLVKCEGLVCRPKDGDEPIPSPDFKPAMYAKVPTPCFSPAQ